MSESDPLVGKTLAERYRVVERLAEGAMGVVYRAENMALQRPVAIKFLHPSVAQQEHLRKRFEVEAQAMGRLSHPNCVSVIDFGFDEVPYLVMEYVEGKTLRESLASGALGTQRALHLAKQLLTALVHAHAQGIIHRDIKPENLLLQQSAGLDDHVRVVDFGLAKLMDGAAGLTAGMALGTPNYMAPEQLQEGGIDARADLYAAGVVMFEMLTGKQPFAADSVGEVLRRQMHMIAPRLADVAPTLRPSGALQDVVARALAKRPSERFPTAQTMLAALEQVPELGAETALPRVWAASPSAPHKLPPPPVKGKAPPSPAIAVVAAKSASTIPQAVVQSKPAHTPDDALTIALSSHDNIADVADIMEPPRTWSRKRAAIFAALGTLVVFILWLTLHKSASPPTPVALPTPTTQPAGHTSVTTAEPTRAKAQKKTPAAAAAPQAASPQVPRAAEPKSPPPTGGAKTVRRASSEERWGTRWKK